MKTSKLRAGDNVVIIAGKDKGKQGTIKNISTKTKKAIVDGINMMAKHVRPNPQAGVEGGIIKREAPISLSNIAILNPETDKADRIGYLVGEDGLKKRIFKSNQTVID